MQYFDTLHKKNRTREKGGGKFRILSLNSATLPIFPRLGSRWRVWKVEDHCSQGANMAASFLGDVFFGKLLCVSVEVHEKYQRTKKQGSIKASIAKSFSTLTCLQLHFPSFCVVIFFVFCNWKKIYRRSNNLQLLAHRISSIRLAELDTSPEDLFLKCKKTKIKIWKIVIENCKKHFWKLFLFKIFEKIKNKLLFLQLPHHTHLQSNISPEHSDFFERKKKMNFWKKNLKNWNAFFYIFLLSKHFFF